MNATETKSQYSIDEDEIKYWARRGTKTAAFLLVIPGATMLGVGYGLLQNQMSPYALMGFGAGLLLWGFIVALSK